MPTSRKQSGFFIEESNPADKLEMVLVTDAGLLRQYSTDGAYNDRSAWRFLAEFGNRGDSHDSARIIQSSAGYLEVVARREHRLAHYWLSFIGWSYAAFFGEGVTGKPAFIQSDYGRTQNFEVVTPREGGGLAHYWRDNDLFTTSPPWYHSTDFGSGDVQNVAMIHSSFGNLELVAQEGADLVFYWRNGSDWNGPYRLFSGIDGPPAFIQSNYGGTGNFEVVVPRLGGGLAHYWRDNDDPNFPWYGPINFGSGSYTDVGLIQHGDGLTVFARPYWDPNQIVFYYRMGAPSWAWSDLFIITLPGSSPTTSTPPTTVPATREHFDFILTGDWTGFITPSPGEVFITVAPPGTDPSRPTRYALSPGAPGWFVSVPASVGGPGIWTFQCHVRGTFGDGTDTGDIWSPAQTWDWEFRNPAAYITLDSEDTHSTSWTIDVRNL